MRRRERQSAAFLARRGCSRSRVAVCLAQPRRIRKRQAPKQGRGAHAHVTAKVCSEAETLRQGLVSRDVATRATKTIDVHSAGGATANVYRCSQRPTLLGRLIVAALNLQSRLLKMIALSCWATIKHLSLKMQHHLLPAPACFASHKRSTIFIRGFCCGIDGSPKSMIEAPDDLVLRATVSSPKRSKAERWQEPPCRHQKLHRGEAIDPEQVGQRSAQATHRIITRRSAQVIEAGERLGHTASRSASTSSRAAHHDKHSTGRLHDRPIVEHPAISGRQFRKRRPGAVVESRGSHVQAACSVGGLLGMLAPSGSRGSCT